MVALVLTPELNRDRFGVSERALKRVRGCPAAALQDGGLILFELKPSFLCGGRSFCVLRAAKSCCVGDALIGLVRIK